MTGRRGWAVGVLLALAVASGFCDGFAQAQPPVKPFPAYVVRRGQHEPGDEYESTSPATLCLRRQPKVCYALKKGVDDYFLGLSPKARVVEAPGEQWVLFQANGTGGSGWEFDVALLRYRDGRLQNLLPAQEYSNQDDWGVLMLPRVSKYPLYVVAHFEWVTEAHWDPHQYKISVYRFDPDKSTYGLLTTFETQRKYRAGAPEGRPTVVLPEQRNIDAHLRAFEGR